MRLDKYLKVSRIIKRRTVAKEICDGGHILINDRPAKAGSLVKPGDILQLSIGNRELTVEIISIAENVKTDQAKELYRVLKDVRRAEV